MTHVKKIAEFEVSDFNLFELTQKQYYNPDSDSLKRSVTIKRKKWLSNKREILIRFENSINSPIKLSEIMSKNIYKQLKSLISQLTDPDSYTEISYSSKSEIKRDLIEKYGHLLKYFPKEDEIWCFNGGAYKLSSFYTNEEKELLILEHFDRDRKKFEQLKSKHSSEIVQQDSYPRKRIPENVRIAVWRRDSGKCAKCGSRKNLEYDHIIPVSEGGGYTARNIELLCQKCNREKSNKIC